jgi:tRNA 2-thiouridine synthesizing protein E
MDAIKKDELAVQLEQLNQQLSQLTESVAYLTKKQQERDALFGEMNPIVKDMMKVGTETLGGLEDRGYFTFMRESARVFDRIVESYGEEDLRALGDNIVRIMDTVRAYTQPRMLAIAGEATEAIDNAEDLEPTGVFGMVRASRDEDVQRGMAVFLAVLRSVGKGVQALEEESDAAPRPRLRAVPTPAPEPKAAPKAKAPKKRAKAAKAKLTPVVIDGVEFDRNGYLADASQWTRKLAGALAASQGINELSERHWVAIDAARNDYLETGASPNIRRVTMISDVTTKELYQLFPKAPGMTLARVAGIPKPVGCI